MWACQTGQFQGTPFTPSVESLAEALLEQPRGASAVIAATSEALESISAEIADGLFRAMYATRTHRLGDGLLEGLRQLHDYNANSWELQFYTLFGDPAMVVNPPSATPGADSDEDGMTDAWRPRADSNHSFMTPRSTPMKTASPICRKISERSSRRIPTRTGTA
jgi:hypothetical protein